MTYTPDWYDTHCPTCDAPEPSHTNTCAVVWSASWKWTCMECGATGPMPADILAPQHDCKSRGPFDEVSRLLVEPVSEPIDPCDTGTASEPCAGCPDCKPAAAVDLFNELPRSSDL